VALRVTDMVFPLSAFADVARRMLGPSGIAVLGRAARLAGGSGRRVSTRGGDRRHHRSTFEDYLRSAGLRPSSAAAPEEPPANRWFPRARVRLPRAAVPLRTSRPPIDLRTGQLPLNPYIGIVPVTIPFTTSNSTRGLGLSTLR
jgi:hypothetical protein